ncbi:uncharacterized protein LOC118741894 [Rhagoletis pomonella]|uniref:uncharacterized protein LOC118741894 n=1 Tax=Rhagoletis pomonella TaxID=28610 RepID=UPI00177E6C49|nr:uncharacterized protein LOC118741894 [Rhagoletis pomonella]
MQLSDGDLVVASIELDKTSFWVASAYMAHDKDVPPDGFRTLAEEAAFKNKPLVASCDANAHNLMWGSTDTNARGESLLDFILGNKLSVLNLGSEPTFITKSREEVLDITLASDMFAHKIKRWRVLKEKSYSDHRYIEFEIDLKTPQVREFRNVRNTDWGVYNNKLRTLLPKIPPRDLAKQVELEGLVNQVTKAMNSSLSAGCPVVRYRGKSKPPWWSKQLSLLRESNRSMFNKAKATRAAEDWEAYKADLKVYKKAVRSAKRKSWQSYCKGIEETTEAARLRRILAKSPCNLGYLKGQGNSWTTTSEESLGLLLDTHFPGNKPVEPNDPQNEGGLSDLGNRLITNEKIEWAIKTFGPYKSPGFDGIHSVDLQQSRDIEGAFNNINASAITGALEELGVDQNVAVLIESILVSRTISIPPQRKQSQDKKHKEMSQEMCACRTEDVLKFLG